MSHQPCAIVGIGQTHHKSRRSQAQPVGAVNGAGPEMSAVEHRRA
jgi:hypothetical protein